MFQKHSETREYINFKWTVKEAEERGSIWNTCSHSRPPMVQPAFLLEIASNAPCGQLSEACQSVGDILLRSDVSSDVPHFSCATF
jgi:hypothetical protein